MPYLGLLVAALVGGFLTLPVFSLVRQSIAALAPERQRRPAYALDSMTTELSFMSGPALAVLIATTVSARAAMLAVGAGVVLSGCALLMLNPPIRSTDEAAPTADERVPRRTWLTPRLVAVLAVSSASTLVLSGTDVAVVAVLRDSGQLQWTGAVLGLWAAYSLIGGFAYGAVRRPLPALALLGLMAAFTVPVGLGGGSWWLLALVLIPAGALCAPTLTATADAVSRMAPPSARGEAMGLHGSALTVGVALGAPISGAVMDAFAPVWGFTAVGAVGGLVTVIVLPISLRRRRDEANRRRAAAERTNAEPAHHDTAVDENPQQRPAPASVVTPTVVAPVVVAPEAGTAPPTPARAATAAPEPAQAAKPASAHPGPARAKAARARSTQPGPTEAKATRPKAAQPTAAQPTAAQPTAAQRKAAQPKAARPKAAQPKAAQPKATQPKAASNGARPGTARQDGAVVVAANTTASSPAQDTVGATAPAVTASIAGAAADIVVTAEDLADAAAEIPPVRSATRASAAQPRVKRRPAARRS
jgi:predicted MFS family arabinose efflux permease